MGKLFGGIAHNVGELVREEVWAAARALVPVLAIFVICSVHPRFAHVWAVFLALAAVVSVLIGISLTIARTASAQQLTGNAGKAHDALHHLLRTACHLLSLLAPDDDFLKLLFLYVAPASAARMSRNTSFKAYLILHVLLVLYRFRYSYMEAMPHLVVIVAMCRNFWDVSHMKKAGEERGILIAEAHEQLGKCALESVKCVFEAFCNASAVLTVDSVFVEDSPTLKTLLGREATEGKAFRDFIDPHDRTNYDDFVSALVEDKSGSSDNPQHESREVSEGIQNRKNSGGDFRMRSISLHLVDAQSIVVEVNVFHACFEDASDKLVLCLGIADCWMPNKCRTKRGSRSRSGDPRQMNWQTCRMEPTFSQFPSGFEEEVDKLNQEIPNLQHRRGRSPPAPSSHMRATSQTQPQRLASGSEPD